jgi:NAD(P)H-hydrate repair Nnr-like enzyme with NAD(P)H-hydrate dehydratase domain
LNDTVLKIGRYPYVVDHAAYAAAAALRRSTTEVIVRRPQEGVYVVAASNPHVVLAKYDPRETGYCPAYNKDARAFLASLGLGTPPLGAQLCGGVPVAPTSEEKR